MLTLHEMQLLQGKQSQKALNQTITRNPHSEMRTNVVEEQFDVVGEHGVRNGKVLTGRQNIGQQNTDLQKMIGDKLNKRYSSKKRTGPARNITQTTAGYHFNIPSQATSNGMGILNMGSDVTI